MLGVAVKPTIKEVDSEGRVTKTLVRAGLWEVQTPQVTPSALFTCLWSAPPLKCKFIEVQMASACNALCAARGPVCLQHAQTQSQILTRVSNLLRLGCSRLGI